MNTSISLPTGRAGDRRRRSLALLILGCVLAAPAPLLAQVLAPSLALSLSPDQIGPGSCTELSITVTNPLSIQAEELAFTINLPDGLTLATPANPDNGCDGTLTAPDGGTTISLTGGRVASNQSCTITVGLTGTLGNTYPITTSGLTSNAGNGDPAEPVDLQVLSFERPGFTKSFSPNPVNFGGRSTLTYILDNQGKVSATGLAFTDVLPPGVVIANPANASTTCPNAPLTADAGSNTISFGDGFSTSLSADSSCTVSVDVIGGRVGLNNSISGDLTISNPQGPQFSCGRACAVLEVLPSGTLQLTKSFLNDPVPSGGTTTLQFTLTNLSRSDTATSITFTDDIDAALSGLAAIGLPARDVCGAGSTLSGTSLLTLTGGTLGPGETCTFNVDLQVPAAAPNGAYPNTTSFVTGDAGGRAITGTPATDILFVEPAPILTKEFIDDPVGAGGTVTLRYTITNTSPTSEVTNLSFTDSIAAIAPETTASSLPADGFCGPGSRLTVTGPVLDDFLITLSSGSLAAGDSCTFDVTLLIPDGAVGGERLSTTSPVTGTVEDAPVTGPPASDTLVIVPPVRLVKEFIDDPVVPGGTATLQFTISNDGEGAQDAINIAFTDNLDAALAGLGATGLPVNDICGAGSQLSGASTLSFTGGTLTAGSTCTFSIPVQIPADAPSGIYPNTTSAAMADVLGLSTMAPPASDTLIVAGLTLTKEFTDDPVLPGGTATLEFTLTNSGTLDATGIFFTDNLAANLPGLTAILPPSPDPPCGAGSSLTAAPGNSVLIFAGGSVLASSSCTFSVQVQVPSDAVSDTYRNVTSDLSATIGGSSVTLPAAAADLVVNDSLLQLQKQFTDSPVAPGNTATLEFTLTNLDNTNTISGISFSDDLEATLPGLTATVLPPDDFCGAGSTLTGSSLLTVAGASLAPGASCTFSVTLQVPSDTPAGTYPNTTSGVTGNIGAAAPVPVSGAPASADLAVQAFTFAKSFSGPVSAGSTAELTFTITNISANETALDLSFNDNLDAMIPGAVAVGLPATNVCGAGSLLTGTSTITLTGAGLLPGGSCTFSVPVQIPVDTPAGFYLNTTSNLRQGPIPVAGPASATLETIVAGSIGDLVFEDLNGTGTREAGELGLDGVTVELLDGGGTVIATTTTAGGGAYDFTGLTAGEYSARIVLPSGALLTNPPPTVSVSLADGQDFNDADFGIAFLTTVAGPIALDLQTGLFKQTLTVTNNNRGPVTAFRILVDGLPADASVFNGQGDSGGLPFLLYNQALGASASISLTVEYYQASGDGGFTPSFTIELLEAVIDGPDPEGAALNRIEALPNGDILLEWISTPGASYTVQFSNDLLNWFNVNPPITATGTAQQWIDNGPPKTPSPPSEAPTRIYRIVLNP